MKVIIMGCGRVGARLAGLLDEAGNNVTVLDTDSYAFRRLPSGFKGRALVGNGIDEEALKRAGIEQADVFFALTQGDNRNIMASQLARHIFGVKRVVCRIYDPLRQEMYESLGIEAISPTTLFADILMKRLESK
jgi:trk system potassium uptake protein TrkA